MLVSRSRQCEKNDTVLTVNYRLTRCVCASCLIDKGQKGMLNCIKKLRKDDSRIGSEYEKEKREQIRCKQPDLYSTPEAAQIEQKSPAV